MLKIFPVFVVVLALGAREYIDLNVPGGLAYADREAVVTLAEETAINCYRGAPPQVQRVLRRMFSDRDNWDRRRSARRHPVRVGNACRAAAISPRRGAPLREPRGFAVNAPPCTVSAAPEAQPSGLTRCADRRWPARSPTAESRTCPRRSCGSSRHGANAPPDTRACSHSHRESEWPPR